MSASEKKAPTTSTSAADGEEKRPDQIREEIEDTREELGDTVAAVAVKTDVKAKAKELGDKAKAAAPDSPAEGLQQAQTLAKQNPRPFAIAGALIAATILWRMLRR